MRTLRAIDLFCGAGGTSTGLEQACAEAGVRLDLTAINHWPVAIESHSRNLPWARHECARIEDLRPEQFAKRGELDWLLASPECTFHSNARNHSLASEPLSDQRRCGLRRVIDWAEALMPRRIWIENVKELLDWGPLHQVLDKHGRLVWRPDPKRKGELFKHWVTEMRILGYGVTWRLECAADYGAPTTRTRLIIQAVLAPERSVLPRVTHFDGGGPECNLLPWQTIEPHIDWSLPMTSIYERPIPLCDNTLTRIWHGLNDQGLQPFLVELRGTAEHQLRSTATPLARPLGTITTARHHWLVKPFLIRYNGTGSWETLGKPLGAVTTRDRFGLARPVVTGPEGQPGELDVFTRMLHWRELAAAQSFPPGYFFSGTAKDIQTQIGNAVPPALARALFSAALRNPSLS